MFCITALIQRTSKIPDTSNASASPDPQMPDNACEEHATDAAVDPGSIITPISSSKRAVDSAVSHAAADVDVVLTAESPSGLPVSASRVDEGQRAVAVAAAVAARLQAEYMAPSRYTSNIFAAVDERWSVQQTIRALLRGSSSSVSLSTSPFVDRVTRAPRPPSAQKSGGEVAFAKRRMSLVTLARSSQEQTSAAVPRPAFTAAAAESSAASSLRRRDQQNSGATALLPPIARKRA